MDKQLDEIMEKLDLNEGVEEEDPTSLKGPDE